MAADPIAVLFVCTGNICRSPTAEGVFRKLVGEAGLAERIVADSAGMIDFHEGSPPDPTAQKVAAHHGYDIAGQAARRIGKRDFARFDYVVGLDRGHHRQLMALRPEGSEARLRLMMEFAPSFGTLDVPDPYGRSEGDFEQALRMIEAGAAGLLDAIRAEDL
ncbi:MAG: low molecular weight phosphotyrosine protein phosphatase [Rhodospirillaceae bacterium]|jgi:protein-tyrosine phosphatase|nr:low molecular weight phosphotyrosine protein phosphatase [Rhodospirillaceae bacterium]MBT6117421.1 low molecular weight phosphotyrosine protein phosphatase [Rhodospirillaceae bacterium]